MSTNAASADKLQGLFESIKSQQSELERLEKEIFEKKEIKSRKIIALQETSMLVDDRVACLQAAKMEYCKHLEYSKNLKAQIEREKSSKCSTFLNVASYEGSLAMRDNERVVSSVHNARVLRDLASTQFDKRKEFKDKLFAALHDAQEKNC